MSDETIPRDLFNAIGEALYGPEWVTPLADALGVERRSVGRWRNGVHTITARFAPTLATLLAQRAQIARDHVARIDKLQDELAAIAPPAD